MTRCNLAGDAVLIVGTVGSKGGNRTIDLIKQRANLRSIVYVAVRQRRRDDLSGVGVHSDVELAPRPPYLRVVLLKQPYAQVAQLQPVLSTRRCTGSELGRVRNTSSVSAWRLKVVWSGTARARPGKAMM